MTATHSHQNRSLRRAVVPAAPPPISSPHHERGIEPITTTAELAAVCERLSKHPFITVDTEFLRESTFYPLLCVAQMASSEEAVVIDALAPDLDLSPFFQLMADERV